MTPERESVLLEEESIAGMSAEEAYNLLRQSGADIGRIEMPKEAIDAFESAPSGEVLTYRRKHGGVISIRKLEDGSWQEVTNKDRPKG